MGGGGQELTGGRSAPRVNAQRACVEFGREGAVLKLFGGLYPPLASERLVMPRGPRRTPARDVFPAG